MKNLLIIDDEKSICNVLNFAFESEFKIYIANSMMEYSNIIKLIKPDIVLLDLKFGNIDGIDLLMDIKKRYKEAIVIIMTAYGTIETSIMAIKKGAYDYVLKPLDLDILIELVENATAYQELQNKAFINTEISNINVSIIGKSAQMNKVFQEINRVKDLNVNVLIQGQSGTGKELVARAIHYEGIRKNQSFIVVNCAAIPQNLIESELFGYEKGAFTGAEKKKKGAFELADKGSIFLDEIGEMDIYCQSKLLRVIQSKELLPLGGTDVKKIDVRIIAATNRNLKKEAEEGLFRMDLYYRLNVFPIIVVPLNERSSDIPMLVENFIKKANLMYNMNIKGITKGVLENLINRKYAGNVRELENIINRACILCDGDYIDENCISDLNANENESIVNGYVSVKLGASLENIEKQMILGTLNFVNGNKSKAARLLGISERSIHYKIRGYTEDESNRGLNG